MIQHFDHMPSLPEQMLGETEFMNYSAPTVQSFIQDAIGERTDTSAKAVALFYAVRDKIRYDPYQISFDPSAYRASQVIDDQYGWCVSKAVLLAACMRSVGIPAAIGLADVKNHLTTDKLRQRMGGVDIFYDHGYAAIYLNQQWFKLVPAFNIELCQRFGVRPTQFDGNADALYQEFDASDRQHMEYLAEHGTWSDLPLAKIRDDFARYYGASDMGARALNEPLADNTARDSIHISDDLFQNK